MLFDDFEQNLTADTEQFTDPAFAEVFAALCEAAQTGRLLVTCRYPIPGAEDALLQIDVPALSPRRAAPAAAASACVARARSEKTAWWSAAPSAGTLA